MEEADPGAEVVVGDVGFGDGEGGGEEIEGGDVRVREVISESDGDGSGADADIGHGDGAVMREALKDGLDEVLGFGAGDEDGGSYAKP